MRNTQAINECLHRTNTETTNKYNFHFIFISVLLEDREQYLLHMQWTAAVSVNSTNHMTGTNVTVYTFKIYSNASLNQNHYRLGTDNVWFAMSVDKNRYEMAFEQQSPSQFDNQISEIHPNRQQRHL